MSGDKDSKTEDATPKRRREARMKGQILKSKEVNVAAIILVSAYVLSWSGTHIYTTMYRFLQATFQDIPVTISSFQPWDINVLGVRSVFILFVIIMPIMAALFATALVVELAQVGFLFTTKPLKPSLEKLHPVKGAKRIVALKSLVELAKNAVKTILIGWVVFSTISSFSSPIIYSVKEPITHALSLASTLLITIAKKVAAWMVAIAFVDYFYQRWEFEKSLRMSKQEVKDEYKQTEGDPLIKGKQKQKMRQMSMGQVRQAVPDADAVVSNPEHYAIGLQYDDSYDAPLVCAMGKNELAIYIKEVAKEHDIPIFEDKKLARELYDSSLLGWPIHPDFYMAVAKIIAQLMKKKKEKFSGFGNKRAEEDIKKKPKWWSKRGGDNPSGA